MSVSSSDGGEKEDSAAPAAAAAAATAPAAAGAGGAGKRGRSGSPGCSSNNSPATQLFQFSALLRTVSLYLLHPVLVEPWMMRDGVAAALLEPPVVAAAPAPPTTTPSSSSSSSSSSLSSSVPEEDDEYQLQLVLARLRTFAQEEAPFLLSRSASRASVGSIATSGTATGTDTASDDDAAGVGVGGGGGGGGAAGGGAGRSAAEGVPASELSARQLLAFFAGSADFEVRACVRVVCVCVLWREERVSFRTRGPGGGGTIHIRVPPGCETASTDTHTSTYAQGGKSNPRREEKTKKKSAVHCSR